MNPYIELVPFTDMSSWKLGGILHAIATKPENRKVLPTDFPTILDNYGSLAKAIKTVFARQRQMQKDPGFVAFAVVLGTSEADAQIYGVTSMLQTEIPGYGAQGVNFALWLDTQRPEALHRVGISLMKERVRWAVGHESFHGYIWTVIRPNNRAAMSVWDASYPFDGFMHYGKPSDYSAVDGVAVQRQLVLSRKTLGEMRLAH